MSSLDDPASSMPSFEVDASGTYVFDLTVTDPSGDSDSDTVEVTTRAVSYEFDLNSKSTGTLDPAGGTLALTDAFGRNFTIEVPAGSIDQETEFALTGVTSIDGLPDGLLPVAGVRMEPAGLTFKRPVRLTMELLPSERNGPWIALLTDDDGERLLLRTLKGSTPRIAALEALVVGVDVPHFSTGVIAEVTPDTDIPPPPLGLTAQERAIYLIEHRIEELLEIIDMLGEPASDEISLIDDPIVALALFDWFQDLEARLDNLAVSPDIDDLGVLEDHMYESVDLIIEAADYLDDSEQDSQFDVLEDAVINQLAETIASYLVTAKDRCASDSVAAQSILESLEFDIVEQFLSSRLSDMFEEEVFECEYIITFADPFQAVFVGDQLDLEYTLTREDGTVVETGRLNNEASSSLSLDDLSLVTETPDTLTVAPVDELFGRKSATLEVGAGPPATAEVLVLPDFTGGYGASGSGTASLCTDPEDEGPGSGAEEIEIVTQAILSAGPGQASIGLAGVGSVVTGVDLTVTLTSSQTMRVAPSSVAPATGSSKSRTRKLL